MSNKVLGPNVGYVDILDIATQAKLEGEAQTRAYNPLRPSSSGKCARELAYEFQEFKSGKIYEGKPGLTPSKSRVFALGHSVEWNILSQFERLVDRFSLRYKQQVLRWKSEGGRQYEGSLDAVFWSEKWKAVIDIKSKNDRSGKKWGETKWDEMSQQLAGMSSVVCLSEQAFWVEDLEAFLEELNDPFFAANFLQLNLYANSDFLKECGVDHAAIIQYNKNDSRLREVRFKPHEGLFLKVLEKFDRVQDNYEAGGTPEDVKREYPSKSHYKCKYCDFRDLCWGDVKKKS